MDAQCPAHSAFPRTQTATHELTKCAGRPVKNFSVVAAIRSTYLTDEGFTPEVAKRASPAAEGLCMWVHAMSAYDKVGPKALTG